ncbi:unnamed protein product [Dicrocoelium dendriticum]|nr:unnamed protein product [Dicrocoelium dendriticum]
MHILIYIALCTTIAFVRAEAEYFSATTEINRALQVGKQLASDLLVYVDLEQTRLERIRKVAQRLALDGITPELLNSPEDFFSNPVNAYLTVRRLAVNWKTDLLSLLDSPKEVDDDKSLSVDKHELAKLRARVEESAPLLPGDSDLSGAAEALLRLQDTYKLDADNIANGKLVTDLKSPRMTAAQCVHLGQQAYESNNFLRAEEWFRVAYKRLWEELVGAEQTGEEGITVNTTDPQEYTLSIPDEAQPSATYILDYLAYALGRVSLSYLQYCLRALMGHMFKFHIPTPASNPGPSAERAIYGFVIYIASFICFAIYFIWAYVPHAILHAIGITYLPHRHWAITGAILPLVTFVTVVIIYTLNHQSIVLPLTSFNLTEDEYSRFRNNNGLPTLDHSEHCGAVNLVVEDLPLALVMEQLYLNPLALNKPN